MRFIRNISSLLGGFGAMLLLVFSIGATPALAEAAKPNIVVIMGDDIGMWNIGAYHRGLICP